MMDQKLARSGSVPDLAADMVVDPANSRLRPTTAQMIWLKRGLGQPGGKLPLFDINGRKVDLRIVRACITSGWAEPWFANPIKPDWLVCKLTDSGRRLLNKI